MEEFSKDDIKKEIYEIIKEGDLQPTTFQCHQLELLITKNNIQFNNMSLKEWYDFLQVNNPLIIKKDQMDDLSSRCEIIIDNYFTKNCTQEIILLDGHGRTLFCLLDHFYKKKKVITIEPKFIIYENDPNTFNWHKLFFPEEIENIQNNIFSEIYNILPIVMKEKSCIIDSPGSFSLKGSPIMNNCENKILYFNFLNLHVDGYTNHLFFNYFINNYLI